MSNCTGIANHGNVTDKAASQLIALFYSHLLQQPLLLLEPVHGTLPLSRPYHTRNLQIGDGGRWARPACQIGFYVVTQMLRRGAEFDCCAPIGLVKSVYGIYACLWNMCAYVRKI
jgi:hypothetical protein